VPSDVLFQSERESSMTAIIIDGMKHARRLREGFKTDIAQIEARTGVTPLLAVVLLGTDAASRLYVSNKVEACKEFGLKSVVTERAADTRLEDLIAIIDALNGDPQVHGILIQLPLPKHIPINWSSSALPWRRT
jgi:methylenetetrahydrofolate dehydrogenase (NADP+) / methenyltetrahydrofolate cyclohydrolase